MLYFVLLDTCCQNIEVVYSSETTPVATMRPERFGRYTLSSETVNGRRFYESDFDEGPSGYGIWWTGSDGSWRIGPVSYKGQVYGLSAYVNEKCVENVHPWNYLPSSGWTSFGSTLSTNCVNTIADSGCKSHKYNSNYVYLIDIHNLNYIFEKNFVNSLLPNT